MPTHLSQLLQELVLVVDSFRLHPRPVEQDQVIRFIGDCTRCPLLGDAHSLGRRARLVFGPTEVGEVKGVGAGVEEQGAPIGQHFG